MAIGRPFVLFVGPTKSGTTWIHAYLESRGDIALPEGMKETFFFDKVYERGYGWYESLFPAASDARMRAEVAPSLFHKKLACERVRQHVPYAKIVCTVRDPFDRAVSHYFHYRMRGVSARSLKEMAEIYPDVIEAGLYRQHVSMWRDALGEDRVYLLSYSLLREDPEEFCRQLCRVLDLEYMPPEAALINAQVNAAQVPRNLFAARLLHALMGWVRRSGVKDYLRHFKKLPIQRWLYSGGTDLSEERAEIKKQSVSISETLSDDWATFRGRPDFPATGKAS